MAKTITFPMYVAERADGERIAGPSTDCQRMMIAATTVARLDQTTTRVRWVNTVSAAEALILRG